MAVWHTPIAVRITAALRELRIARGTADLSREINAQTVLDALLDRYAAGER